MGAAVAEQVEHRRGVAAVGAVVEGQGDDRLVGVHPEDAGGVGVEAQQVVGGARVAAEQLVERAAVVGGAQPVLGHAAGGAERAGPDPAGEGEEQAPALR